MRFARGNFAFADRRLTVPSLHAVLWWALAATITGLAAAILWALVTPVSPLGAWRPASVRTMPAPARAALFASLDPFNRQAGGIPAAASGNAAVTSLALTLFGTRSTPGGQGSAIIAGADGVQNVVLVGAEVMPGVTLAEVAFDHVTLSRNGARELLYIDQSKAAPSASALVAAAPPAAGSGGPTGPLTVDAVRSGISFAPRAEGGKVSGLEVQPAGDGNSFRAAGFQAGDVIVTVGGKPVTGAGDGAALASQLRPGSSIAVTVKRGDQTLPLAITLAP